MKMKSSEILGPNIMLDSGESAMINTVLITLDILVTKHKDLDTTASQVARSVTEIVGYGPNSHIESGLQKPFFVLL